MAFKKVEKVEKKKPGVKKGTFKMNGKQEAFCEEYFVDFNQQEAAIRAGYSPASARVMAIQLMKNPFVIEKINGLRKDYAQRIGVTAEWMMLRLKEIADSNVLEFIEENTVTDLSKVPKEKGRIIKKVTFNSTEFQGVTTTNIQLELHNKLAALEMLAKHLGFYEKDNSQKPATVIPATIVVKSPTSKD